MKWGKRCENPWGWDDSHSENRQDSSQWVFRNVGECSIETIVAAVRRMAGTGHRLPLGSCWGRCGVNRGIC